jgi:hypothetical protein
VSVVTWPDDTLAEVRALATRFFDDRHERLGKLTFDDARRLGELVLVLDAWLVRGGDLPTRWNVPRSV